MGEKAAYVLAQKFVSMNKLQHAGLNEFEAIYEIGPVMAESIMEFFMLPGTRELIEKLKKAQANFEEKVAPIKKTALSNKTIVFTGELMNHSRAQAEEIARKLGANPTSSVSKNTDFVVAGENAGSKLDKARKLGVKIIDEKQFSRIIASE